MLSLAVLMIMMSGCVSSSTSLNSPTTTDQSLPQVTGIKTISGANEIGLEWAFLGSQDIKGFYIFRSEANGVELSHIATIDDKFATHYTDTNLQSSSSYRYSIKSYADSGVSRDSVIVTANTIKTIDSVAFIQATKYPGRVKVIWRPHSDVRVVSYEIQRADKGSTSFKTIAKLDGRLNAEYIDSSVRDGADYDYIVYVKTANGEISNPSSIASTSSSAQISNSQNTVSAKKATELARPVIGEIDSSDGVVVISWEAVAGASGYALAKESVYGEDLIAVNGTSYTDKDVKTGGIYSYKVIALDEFGSKSMASKKEQIVAE